MYMHVPAVLQASRALGAGAVSMSCCTSVVTPAAFVSGLKSWATQQQHLHLAHTLCSLHNCMAGGSITESSSNTTSSCSTTVSSASSSGAAGGAACAQAVCCSSGSGSSSSSPRTHGWSCWDGTSRPMPPGLHAALSTACRPSGTFRSSSNCSSRGIMTRDFCHAAWTHHHPLHSSGCAQLSMLWTHPNTASSSRGSTRGVHSDSRATGSSSSSSISTADTTPSISTSTTSSSGSSPLAGVSTSTAASEDTSTAPTSSSSKGESPSSSPRHDLALLFTCTVCDTRSAKSFSRGAYERGVVLVRCPGCSNTHLIADHLGWFGEEPFKIDEYLESQGQKVVRATAAPPATAAGSGASGTEQQQQQQQQQSAGALAADTPGTVGSSSSQHVVQLEDLFAEDVLGWSKVQQLLQVAGGGNKDGSTTPKSAAAAPQQGFTEVLDVAPEDLAAWDRVRKR